MLLSLDIFNNLVLTMSSQIGKTLAKRRMQKLENLHYYVLSTLFPLLVHLDNKRGEFLKSWMAYQEFTTNVVNSSSLGWLIKNSMNFLT